MGLNLEPVADRIIVKRDVAASKTKGGLALPDQAREIPRLGTVLAVGPGQLRPLASGEEIRFPMQCKVGDRVVLPNVVELLFLNPDDDKDELVCCQDCQVLAIIHPEKDAFGMTDAELAS